MALLRGVDNDKAKEKIILRPKSRILLGLREMDIFAREGGEESLWAYSLNPQTNPVLFLPSVLVLDACRPDYETAANCVYTCIVRLDVILKQMKECWSLSS